MFERFTERARQTVVMAQDEARHLKHNYIGSEHILLGIIRESEGLGSRVMRGLGATEDNLRGWIRENVGEGDEVMTSQIPFTPRAKKVLELALREALSLGHNYIGTEHVLLGVIREPEGTHQRYLDDMHITSGDIRSGIIAQLAVPGRPQLAPVDRIGVAIKSMRTSLKQIDRSLSTIEAALEQEMPEDPGL